MEQEPEIILPTFLGGCGDLRWSTHGREASVLKCPGTGSHSANKIERQKVAGPDFCPQNIIAVSQHASATLALSKLPEHYSMPASIPGKDVVPRNSFLSRSASAPAALNHWITHMLAFIHIACFYVCLSRRDSVIFRKHSGRISGRPWSVSHGD